MTQLVINIENPAILPSLKKVLSALDGVSIAKPMKKKKNKTELDLAIEEVRSGDVTHWDSAGALIEHINRFGK
ncbi:MAG: response regulator [Muribaculaceae bacterium]|nr:response regulator [Muribaculaceae bacterium]MDE6771440.1 response regulator [Muribaculaceae bacterium]